MNYYLHALNNYSEFSGRSSRSEFWYFTTLNIVFIIASFFLDKLLGTTFILSHGQELPYGYLFVMYIMFTLIPSLSVTVRRLHDTGKSGRSILIGLIPVIGTIWLLIQLSKGGKPGQNGFGPNPLKETAPSA